ncbi:MAG: hypothetical protein J6112_04970 [Clostridia bacterium]|nr:hypothetical protein [Clostridia bacterium]
MTPLIKKWIFVLIIGLLAIGVGVLLFTAFDPIVNAIEKTRAEVAGSNAFQSYLMAEDRNFSSPVDVYIVHHKYHIHCTSLNYKDAEMIKLTDVANFVRIGKVLEEGTYESGVYVEEVSEKVFLYKPLNPGDSLVGLRVADGFESIPGYTYYGTMENCDIYVRK